jgi:hypothetical protein
MSSTRRKLQPSRIRHHHLLPVVPVAPPCRCRVNHLLHFPCHNRMRNLRYLLTQSPHLRLAIIVTLRHHSRCHRCKLHRTIPPLTLQQLRTLTRNPTIHEVQQGKRPRNKAVAFCTTVLSHQSTLSSVLRLRICSDAMARLYPWLSTSAFRPSICLGWKWRAYIESLALRLIFSK